MSNTAATRNTVSLDQLLAKHLGDQTRFPSLVLGLSGSNSPSYTENGSMIPAETSPSRLFRRLFVNDSPADQAQQAARAKQGRSIMDVVADDAKALQRELGNGDRDRLDAYFTSVRELEVRLKESEAWAERPKPEVSVAKPIDIGKGEQFAPDFLELSPNNKIPAILDPDGPGGKPVSVFESGAILQYLGRKTGKFYPTAERRRIAVEEWLFWQVGGLGPMAGQTHHFRNYAKRKVPYGIERYTNEVNRIYGVMDRRLESRSYLAGTYSIADIACYPWARLWMNQGQDISHFPNVAAWLDRVAARPAVRRGMEAGKGTRLSTDIAGDRKAQKVLFGQKAR